MRNVTPSCTLSTEVSRYGISASAVCPDTPPAEQQTIREVLALLERQLREPGASFTSRHAVRDWLHLHLASLEREEFIALFLDNQHCLITHETLFTGTINHTQVHPREVVKAALKHNAAAVIIAHCHPSGLVEPSMPTDRSLSVLRMHWN